VAGKPRVMVSVYGGVVSVEAVGDVDIAVIEWDNEEFFSVEPDPISFDQAVRLELESLKGIKEVEIVEDGEVYGWTCENRQEAINKLENLL